jgi:hypothetical protein
MIMTGENLSTRIRACLSAILSFLNFSLTGPGSVQGLRGGWSAADCLSHSTAVEDDK